MARPRRQVYSMTQYLDNVKEGYITNDADTQRNPAWKAIIDGLAVTILNDDYIPPIILAEEDCGQIRIADGGSRTASFMMILFGNHKIKSTVENPIIEYKVMTKDENGDAKWEEKTFDIRNKTFEQFPKELQKKFLEYQVETVIHEHCDKEKVAMYIKRYNLHTAMNANQKMFTYAPKVANLIRKTINRPFFVNNSNYTESEKEKGVLERVILETNMCAFHLSEWNKNNKKLANLVNDLSTEEEFKILDNNFERLEKIITSDTKDIFNSKDSFIWLTIFNNFTKLGINDIKFAEFLKAFKGGLRNKAVDGKLFDTVDQSGSTKDKAIILAKLHILETLMNEFLHINKEDLKEVDVFEFVKENIDSNITEEDIADYKEDLDSYVKIDSPIRKEDNLPSLVAMVAYGYMTETDVELEGWFVNYEKEHTTFIKCQKENYLHMKESFDKYLLNRGVR